MKDIQVCFSPALYPLYHDPGSNVVVIDILRATTAICSALSKGAKCIIPVGTIEQAKEMKEKGYVLAAERDGKVLDFADFGNSPFNFTTERVLNKEIAYSTTNGTQAVEMAKDSKSVIIGAFVNLSSVISFLSKKNENLILFCAGWKNRFNLEDTLCAGAIAKELIEKHGYSTQCDSTNASIDLWDIASPNLLKYIEKAAHRHRLKQMVLDDVVEFCHTPDALKVLPVYREGKIYNLYQNEKYM